MFWICILQGCNSVIRVLKKNEHPFGMEVRIYQWANIYCMEWTFSRNGIPRLLEMWGYRSEDRKFSIFAVTLK